jgi:hypothetical protein
VSEHQTKSAERIKNHGEVYTNKREVDAMLDLVSHEMERIESRVLEPACGTGNFLAEVLSRKLGMVKMRYQKEQFDYERNAVIAVSSIYGIDILEDNVEACRERLFEIFSTQYKMLFKDGIKEECLKVIRYILEKNIIWGDALSLRTVCGEEHPIVFCEWSPVNGDKVKRRDFSFRELMSEAEIKAMPLFSDMGEEVYLPTPIKDYPLKSFLRLHELDE